MALPEDPAARHRHTVKVSTFVSTIASVVAIGGVLVPVSWRYVLSPIVVSAVSESVSAQVSTNVEAAVQKKVAPLSGGFKVLLQQQIDELEREVDRLEFEQRAAPDAWTLDKVNELREKTNRLRANRQALASIVAAETP